MEKLNNNNNFLKIIAVITMVIDHIGLFLLNNNIIFRSIGRISFPLFFFCIFIGYFKTKNLKKYLFRLFILAGITQLICYFCFNEIMLNVCFTFLIELILLYLLDKKKNILFVIAFSLSLFLIPICSYLIHAIILTPIFYYLKNTKFYLSISYILFYIIFSFSTGYLIYLFNIIPLFLMIFKTNINIKINKYAFYIIYPLQYIIIYIIQLLIN